MKKIVYESYDDVSYKRDGSEVPATRIDVILTFDGECVTLDLTDKSYQEVLDHLRPLLDMGSPYKRSHHATAVTARGGARMASREFYRGMRAYADSIGIDYRTTISGAPYYSKELRDKYKAYLEALEQSNPQAAITSAPHIAQ